MSQKTVKRGSFGQSIEVCETEKSLSKMKHIYSDSARQYKTFELLTITLSLTKPEI